MKILSCDFHMNDGKSSISQDFENFRASFYQVPNFTSYNVLLTLLFLIKITRFPDFYMIIIIV